MTTEYEQWKRNIINESGQPPSLFSYIQAVEESLRSISPKTVSDIRRIEIARENLSNVRRHAKRMSDQLIFLQEENRQLQEEKAKRKK